ncbi:unnamed protein product, partial [Notodromas monacha]
SENDDSLDFLPTYQAGPQWTTRHQRQTIIDHDDEATKGVDSYKVAAFGGWNDLPPSVGYAIFATLPPGDLFAVSNACSSWRRAARDPRLWPTMVVVQPQMMNIPMDVWGEVEGTFGVKFLKFSYNNFDSDAFGNGLEGLVTMYEGTMRTNEVLIEVLTARPKDKWNLVGETRISCSLETGSAKAFSHNFGPRIRLSNYQDVVDHLTDSKTVTLTHSLANCENFDSVSYGNLKTGHTVDTFYVYQQGDQEMLKVVSTTAIFRNTQGFGSPYAVFTTNTNVFADGTVQVKPSFWDTIEWDNELGDGTGGSEVMEFICQLDPESTVFWASPDIVQPTFVGYSEVATALESGHELELVLDATECGNDVGQPNPATGLGTSIGGWEKTANGTIGFTAFHITEQGMIHYETYLLNPDNTLNLHINQFIYIGGINVMEVDVICEDISKAGFFYSRHPDLREDKNTMELLQEEVVSTGRPSVVINYFNCQDSAFGSEVTLAGFPAKFNYLSG